MNGGAAGAAGWERRNGPDGSSGGAAGRPALLCAAIFAVLAAAAPAAELAAGDDSPRLIVQTPCPPPDWALLERRLLEANAEACEAFYQRYFDRRGYLQCTPRWGGDDGPDDAIENLADWPLLYALGGAERVLRRVRQAWEGHLRQYTEARTVVTPLGRDGMYYKEFPTQFDWQHIGEGLRVFNQLGLCQPNHPRYAQRVRRYAGFYMNEDPGAPNYDPKRRIIRSLFNGSRGPLLRQATAVDWAGDPIEVRHRFRLGHGERSYEEMLAHFEDYTDIVGDHPLNLLATTLAVNAYLLTGEPKYRRWLLSYVDAWRERMAANGGVLPSNVGLDGRIGGACQGKWYGGVYGWGFTVVEPQTGRLSHRNRVARALVGLMNAYLLTGDDQYLDPWRKQADAVNAQRRMVDGRPLYPRMHGDRGWYAYEPTPYQAGAFEIYYLSMRPEDRRRAPANAWLDYLEGRRPDYPREALAADLARIRQRAEGMRRDPSTPDTRLADDPMRYNPASVESLVRLACAGMPTGRWASVLHCRLRYFDPARRRPGLPPDVAALVTQLDAKSVTVELVNVNPVRERTVTLQAGGYGEHAFTSVSLAGRSADLASPWLEVRLAPGCGASLRLGTRRYVRQPTVGAPWDRRPLLGASSVLP